MMKLIAIIVFILCFVGCATTSPTIEKGTISNKYKAKEIKNFLEENDITLTDNGKGAEMRINDKALDDYLNDKTTDQFLSNFGYIARLANIPNIYERLGKKLLHQPDRVYKNIELSSVYKRLISEMKKHKFYLETMNHENGILFGIHELGVIKKFLIWEWRRKQFITFIVLPVNGSPRMRMYNISWVEEKPPLSTEFVEVKSNESEIKTVKQISDSIDIYVLKNGGEL